MAQKRMFDKAIIDTDRFMDLSMSAKALYFLLGMEADDEGFVSYKKVMRIHGGNQDDIKNLIAKEFLIYFPSGVVVITHWNENNYLDKNRIKRTSYQEEKQLIEIKDNKYSMLNNRSTNVKQPFNQYSIEENSIKENIPSETSSDTPPKDTFDYQTTLNRWLTGKDEAYRLIAQMFQYKNLRFDTSAQMQAAARRHLKASRLILPFSQDQRDVALSRMLENKALGNEWTLETLYKYLTK